MIEQANKNSGIGLENLVSGNTYKILPPTTKRRYYKELIKTFRKYSYQELWGKLKRKFERDSSGNFSMFSNHYTEWRRVRIQFVIDYYGKDFFKGKTLLELGCGYGDIGSIFASLGAKVTCSDARQEHLEVVKKKHPEVKTIQIDLDKEWPTQENFDIIIDFGVLYHLKNYEFHLKNVCSRAKYLILETEVSDSKDDTFVIYIEEGGYDQAFNSIGCRPSSSNIEKILTGNTMKYKRYDDEKLNAGFHCYDWKENDSRSWYPGQRRFWFAEKM